MDNIPKRGRSHEQDHDDPELWVYYPLLRKHFGQWYEDHNYGPKMKISIDGLDIYQEADWERVSGLIKQEKKALGLK